MKKFVLKREYISDVTDTKYMTLNMYDGSTISGMSHARIDHPEFTKLRDMLEQQGYISTERSWTNGDRVLKPFSLNTLKFKIGEQFPCAAALDVRLSIKK
jgi:hypothetical protein